jgi:hypothetical protein
MPLEAATTFGINVKFGENPIGFFGTGLKYAIAVCVRLGGKFRLFIGNTEYEFYVKPEDFRGKEFGFIRMRKRTSFMKGWSYQKLAYTTELGKNWHPWMAIRELASNTKDEKGQWFQCDEEYFKNHVIGDYVKSDHTTIVIECPEMEEAFNEEEIFLPEKEMIAEIGPVQIFKGSSNHIFNQGLRVTDLDKPSFYTYNFTAGITLTEDRTSKYPYIDDYRIMEALMATTSIEMIEPILDDEDQKYHEASLPFDQTMMRPRETFLGEIAARAATGRVLPKRVRTLYRTIQEEAIIEELITVKMKAGDIVWLREFLLEMQEEQPKRVVEAIEKALGQEDIPF